MLTFSTQAFFSDETLYGALTKKAAGAIRSDISNCSQLGQSVLAKAMADDSLLGEMQQKKDTLQARAKKIQQILANPDYARLWEPYPFNAGYFMCLRLKELDAETYRRHLLDKFGVGVIADGQRDIRIAFSSVDVDQLENLYSLLADAAKDLMDGDNDAIP
jgi:aspartate/tyrosine/aromatic aminotransferase